jgi:hypothetical protein
MLLDIYIHKALHDAVDYHKYIESPEWKEKVARIKAERGNRCQLCGVSGFVSILDGHHNTYERLGCEKDTDIAILCRGCHGHFHKGENKPGNTPKVDENVFSCILKNYGVTFTNDDPFRKYEHGKAIIQHIINGFNPELYDYYNKVNIHILNTALKNIHSDGD